MWIILALGTGIIVTLWFFRPQPALRSQSTIGPPAVEVILASPQTYQIRVKSQGTIAPRRQIDLVAEIAGRVVSVSDQFVDGGIFNAGDVLVQLDDRDYKIAVVEAQSLVADAERVLALERGQARQAEREWRDLGSREANDLFLRKPQVKAAEAALAAAQATLQQARLNLNRTQIRVPFDGRILTTEVDLGQFISRGSVVADVYDSQQAEVRLPLTTKQLLQTGLDLGQLVNAREIAVVDRPQITLSAMLGEQKVIWQARIVGMDGSVDTSTRFIHLIAIVDQPFSIEQHQQPLLMGAFVEASIPGRRFSSALRLPSKAIVDNRVFIVEDTRFAQGSSSAESASTDSAYRLRPHTVTVIAQEEEMLWVDASGIEVGQWIVVSDPRVLREGMTVNVVEAEAINSDNRP